MKFSLVLATTGRTTELSRFLESLDRQTMRDFELIVVDQNPDDRLVPILAPYQGHFPLKHQRSERGLSRARNSVLCEVRGEVVGFPDDDCWYISDLLERVSIFLDTHSAADGVSGNCIDSGGDILRRGPHSSGWITKSNLFHRVHSFAMFFRLGVIARVGMFDEALGAGSGTAWGSAEDHDYVARALTEGCRIYYDASIGVCHPDAPSVFDEHEIQKERSYARGQGRFLRKNGFSRGYFAYRIARSLGGAAIGAARLDFGKIRYHWAAAFGKLEGWRSNPARLSTHRARPLPPASRKDVLE
ncbi:MAG TPA: glycosyltransferase family A protein [Candidatus Binataceae bacterium]|nr:glycosyltransferase family A protein [Candidatus Binataceae bacterium]